MSEKKDKKGQLSIMTGSEAKSGKSASKGPHAKKGVPRRRKRKFKPVFSSVLLVLLFCASIYLVKRFYLFEFDEFFTTDVRTAPSEQEKELWLTIFVHGSFGSTLGLLNVYDVISGKVEGTQYKKIVNKMRKDPFFYKDQPILQKGLCWVKPTFYLHKVQNKKYAAYPFCQAYKRVTELASPGTEKNYFYTFGWSGLVSQRRRRSEAIRFYNAVSAKLKKYHEKGMHPKIRVLTHSHGGNLIANIAAIDEILRLSEEGKELPGALENGVHPDRKESLLEMYKFMNDLPYKEDLPKFLSKKKKKKKSQKRWDYRPRERSLRVGELILWGMPVQPETDHLFANAVFEKVYHFYSGEDLVQRIDWFSTKKGYSDRRFDLSRLSSLSRGADNVSQGRIMVGRKVQNSTSSRLSDTKKSESIAKPKKESFWSILFSGGALISPNGDDPTHKELWFFSWDKKDADSRRFVLDPFPVAVFTPFFVKLIDQEGLADVDINIAKKEDSVEFCLLKHNDLSSRCYACIEHKFLDSITKKIEPWRHKYVSSENLFDLIGKYFVR